MTLSDADRDTVVAWARSHPEIEEVWLFGSRAVGDSRPDSDIDLAVMTPTELDGSKTSEVTVTSCSGFPRRQTSTGIGLRGMCLSRVSVPGEILNVSGHDHQVLERLE